MSRQAKILRDNQFHQNLSIISIEALYTSLFLYIISPILIDFISYFMFLVIEGYILWKNIQFGGKMLKNSLTWYLQIDDKLC